MLKLYAIAFPLNSKRALCSFTFSLFATALHYLILLQLLHLGHSAIYATSAGALGGALTNYFFQCCWVFHNPTLSWRNLWRYAVLCISNIFVNYLLISLLTLFTTIPIVLAQVLTSVLLAFANLYAYQRVVFYERTF